MIILIILLIKFSYQEFIRLFNDEVYTCGFRKKALDLLIRQEGDGSGGSNWGGGAAFYGGETGSFAGTADGGGLVSPIKNVSDYATAVIPLISSVARYATNWIIKFDSNGKGIIHNPSDTTVWSVSGGINIVLAPNSGGPDQSFFFKEISPDKYIIIDYKSQCIEFNTYKSTFECKKCTGSVFQNFVILYDMDGEACCSYVANKYVIKPFGRYRKIYDSMRHHRAGINNSITRAYLANYRNYKKDIEAHEAAVKENNEHAKEPTEYNY